MAKTKFVTSADGFTAADLTPVETAVVEAPVILEETEKTEIVDSAPVEEVVENIDENLRKKIFLDSTYVTLNGTYKVQVGIYELLKRSIYAKTNILLLGATGSGKTELVMNLAAEMGLPLNIFDMGTMLDPVMSMVGTHTIVNEGDKTISKFSVSRFSQVIQKPGIVLLDELSRANVLANNLLFPCLDSRRELSMEYSFHDQEPIKIHPECVFIATANIGGQYTGTHRMDQALVSRFMSVHIEEPPLTEIEKILTKEFGFSKHVTKSVIQIYEAINQKHAKFEIQINLTLRSLKIVCSLIKSGFTIYDAFYIVTKGMSFSTNDMEQQSVISAIIEGS